MRKTGRYFNISLQFRLGVAAGSALLFLFIAQPLAAETNAGCSVPMNNSLLAMADTQQVLASVWDIDKTSASPTSSLYSDDNSSTSPSLSVPDANNRPIKNGVVQAPPGVPQLSPKKLSRQQIAQFLGWVDAPDSNLICKGYYVEPNLLYGPPLSANDKQAPITISADQSILSQTDTSRLSGNVKITQPGRSIEGDQAYINRNPTTFKANSIDIYGQVILREPGNLAVANQGHFDLLDKSASLSDVIYRMTFGTMTNTADNPPNSPLNNTNVNGWGIAKTVDRQADGVIKIYKGSYSACPPPTNIWHIYANNMELNHTTGRGNAENALFYLGDMPVLYTPYFSFPIDNRRQTGFLYPTVGHSTQSGYDVSVPFYWNIAPNYDALITPDEMTNRGLQLNAQFRYLTDDSTGNIHGSFLPSDNEFASFQEDAATDPQYVGVPGLSDLENDSDDRYLISWKDTRSYNSNWSSYLYLNHVSDDYYFEDFDSDPAQVTDNQIINQADVYYNNEHWHFTGQLEGYQTLHPVNQSYVANQYKELPELVLNGQYPDLGDGFNFAINNQFDDFTIVQQPGSYPATQPEGMRLNITPDLNHPYNWVWGFFKPDLQLSATQYDLSDQIPGEASDITRILPIFDIDTGLFFDKNTSWLGKTYQQTLEPRLFYLYVPYQNQDDIPLFDTSVQPFSYSQLFQTNRFTGLDRIGDANQLSLALTSRFIDEQTGDEKFRASIGQIVYFEDRQVNIDSSTLDLATLDNEVPSDTPTSPIAAELDYYFNRNWDVTANMAWDPNYAQTNNANLMFQYKRDNTHIVNVGYTFLRGGDAFVPPDGATIPSDSSKNNLNQTDFSVVWPIARNWTFLGRWNYNISHDYPQTYFGGVQYDACCWSLRALAGRSFNYLDNNDVPQFDNQVYIQIAFKTLGSVGSSSSSLLSNIPGYVDDFGKLQ